MPTMRCPQCGSCADIREDRWECEACGGSGPLPARAAGAPGQERAETGRTAADSEGVIPPEEGTPLDDGAVYRYCAVRIGGKQTYPYLTGGLPVKKHDWVEVPFGDGEAPCRGQVTAVFGCTRLTAPYPPEQSRTVLRIDASGEAAGRPGPEAE